MISQVPVPTKEAITSFYPTEYYAFNSSVFHWPNGLKGQGLKLALNNIGYDFSVKNRLLSTLFSGYYKIMYSFLDDIPEESWGKRYLDLGSGANGTVSLMSTLGWQASGLDPSRKAAAIGQKNGLDIQYGTASNHSWEPETFDFIYSHHSFEHIAEPLLTLNNLKALLRPGGRVLIVQPNADSLCARFGEFWGGLAAPLHIHLHTPNSMKILALKAGLNIEFQRSRANPQDVLDTLMLLMRISIEKQHVLSSRAARLAIMPLLRIAEMFGQGCDLVTLLRKQP